MTQARIVTDINSSNHSIECQRANITSKVHALSHRWQERDGSTKWTVHCEGESYTCQLFPQEATNLENYVEKYGPLWLDYICIKQGDENDKIAQVSIMGSIYSNATSLIVGVDLAPRMPGPEYIHRAWCIQERMFGKVKFPWNFDNEDPDQLIAFACDLLGRLPGLDAISDKLLSDYDSRENWRVKAIRESVSRFPEAADEIRRAVPLMEQNRKLELAKLVFKIRELVSCDEPVDPRHWNTKMFTCVSAFALDRLFGVWGVPMHHKNIQLPYDNPKRAWQLIVQHYPGAEYAFYIDRDMNSHCTVSTAVHHLLQCGGTFQPSEPIAEDTWKYNKRSEYCSDDQVLHVIIRRGHGFASIVWDDDESVGMLISYDAIRAHQGKNQGPFLHFVNEVRAKGRKIFWRCQFELSDYVSGRVTSGEWN